MQILYNSGILGAKIHGVDVNSVDDHCFADIYKTWLKSSVLVISGQNLTLEEFCFFGRKFGKLIAHPSKSTRHPARPEVTVLGINKIRSDGSLDEVIYKRGADWHTDGAYHNPPLKATMLHALKIPSVGGDTLFSSMYAAYDAIPLRLKRILKGKCGAFTYGGRLLSSSSLIEQEDWNDEPVWHPLLFEHPETKRMALYYDPGKIVAIEGLSTSDTVSIIDELSGLMIQRNSIYRHRWTVGDVLIWDNRAVFHKAAADYPPVEERVHWRLSIV